MSSTKKFNCIFCDDTFDDKGTFQVHFRQHGDPNFHHLVKGRKRHNENAEVSKADGPDTVSCDVCTETFPTISKAITHKHKVHPDHESKYFCPWCGKLFTMKHLYNKHITSHSSGDKCEKSFHCDFCEVDFYNPAALIYHNKFFHRQDPDSPTAGYSKKRKMVYNVLMQVFYCAFCGDEYINRVNLQKHMCDDHSDENQSPEEVLRCPLCVAIFYHLDAYEIHLTFHSAEDVYGNSEEEHKNELPEYTLETVPPVAEKVENTDEHENNINSIGIDQFLQLAIETPAESTEKDGEHMPDQFKQHKKHKKHKKSKKAITLDQFLNMNKDVFGECLDFQGAVEVPSQVVAKQLKMRKPRPQPASKSAVKVISTANLEKLKQQGIVVKMKSANKAAAGVPGVKRNAGPNIGNKEPVKVGSLPPKEETLDNAAESIISKIINQPNSQLKIVRKPAMEVNSNETKPSSPQLLSIKTNDDQETKIPSPQSKSFKTEPETKPSSSPLKGTIMEKDDTRQDDPTRQSNSDRETNNETEQNTEIESNDNYHSHHTNSKSVVQQPLTTMKNLSQEITIKPINRIASSDKLIVKSTEENIEKGYETDDDVIHIDNDDDVDLRKDNNINDRQNIKEEERSNSHSQESPTANPCMELVLFNKNVHHDSDEDDNLESESTSNLKNVEQQTTFNKIRNFNQNVSIKSINASQKVTMKSMNSSKGGNMAQMSQKIQIQKFQQTSIEQPSHSRQRLNTKNIIQHHTQSPKPKTADSLRVMNSFKQINFNDSDDDEFCNDGDSDEINSTEKVNNECNTVNNLKKFNQQITVKPLNKTAPLQRRHIGKDPTTSSFVEHFSDNSNTDNEMDFDNEHVPIEPQELNANQIAMNKLKNSNITVKGMNDMKNKIIKQVSKQSLIQRQSIKEVKSDDENDTFENEDFAEEMSNEHDHSSDEDILTPVRDLHQEAVNKLLHSNQSLSIKPFNQSNNSKATMMKPLHAQHIDNNLQTTNKNLSAKSLGGNKNSAQDPVTNNQRKLNIIESSDTNHNQSRDTSARPAKPILNSKPVAQVRNVAKPIVQSKICNREVANANQAQTVKQEVTVKTMQTQAETVVEEITTTTVRKTIRTVSNQIKQETSTSASGCQIKEMVEASNIQGRNIQNIRPPVKQIQNVNQGIKVRQAMTPQQRMVRPLPNNPLRGSSPATAMRPNVHQPRPKSQSASVMQKNSPSTMQQPKSFIAKPLKVAQNVARPQKVLSRMPEADSSGPFSCFKKPVQSLIPFNDDTTANQAESMTSHMSKSQQIITTKSVKGGSVVTSSHQKSEVTSLSQQLTKLSNTSGLKIVKTSTSSSSEVERSEVSAQKRTALDAIEKLQKQGLLVKKPRMDLDSDIPGSDDEFAYDSEDHT